MIQNMKALNRTKPASLSSNKKNNSKMPVSFRADDAKDSFKGNVISQEQKDYRRAMVVVGSLIGLGAIATALWIKRVAFLSSHYMAARKARGYVALLPFKPQV